MVDDLAVGIARAVAGPGHAEGCDHVVDGISQGGGHGHHAQLGLLAVFGEAVLED